MRIAFLSLAIVALMATAGACMAQTAQAQPVGCQVCQPPSNPTGCCGKVGQSSRSQVQVQTPWPLERYELYPRQWQPLSEYCGVSKPSCNEGCSMFTP